MNNNFILLIIDRIIRLYWFILAMAMRPFIKIKKGRVICWAYNFRQYSCNPMYITDYILENYLNNFEIYWAFKKNVNIANIDKRIQIVYFPTINYLITLYSAEFVITNLRTNKYGEFFVKKKNQKYIMTWHGSTPLKKIEKDATDTLDQVYIKSAMFDSIMCDLMLSNSMFFTRLIRQVFWYDGEVLQKGLPRNDLFYNKKKKIEILDKVSKYTNRNLKDTTIVMYAPTFRDSSSAEQYKLNWPYILDFFETKFQKKVNLFLRLHPNVIEKVDIDSLIIDKRMQNLCFYHDMQELLCVADILITDYSSTMFDMALMNKICFLYAKDVEEYNRGFYFNIRKLPFPFSESEDELINNINLMDIYQYKRDIDIYKQRIIGISENGLASQSVANWMVNKMNITSL